MMKTQQILFELLRHEIAGRDVAVALSGGVDSAVVLQALAKLKSLEPDAVGDIHAVTFDTVLNPSGDLASALSVVKQCGTFSPIVHKVLQLDELADPRMEFNPENRCYLCKMSLFTRMQQYAQDNGIPLLLDGTNADDLLIYRPGRAALEELSVFSPLALAHITKIQVREIAADNNIIVADKPSTPCMATRLPYGERLDKEVLEKINVGEDFLRTQLTGDIRLRVHGNVARIEVNKETMDDLIRHRELIVDNLKKLGFHYVTMDLAGFHSGSMDEFLKKDSAEER